MRWGRLMSARSTRCRGLALATRGTPPRSRWSCEMCGIAGQLRHDGRPVDPGLVDRMSAAQEHRGPDPRGSHLRRARRPRASSACAVIDLAHRRPADLQRGRLGRRRPQRRDLQLPRAARAAAARRATASPPTATPRSSSTSTRRTAPTASSRLHGMFAFALWDARAPAAAARARPGRQEAAVLRRARRRRSASPPSWRRCSQDPEIPREPRPRGARRATWRYGYVPAPLTALRGVRKLPPGHTLVVRSDGARDDRALLAARLRAQARRSAIDASSTSAIRAALRAATRAADDRRRAARRLPLGRDRLVRGRRRDGRGIDASPCGRSRSASTDERFDELPHARRSPQQFGTEHEEFVVRADAIELLPRIVRHYGEPFADSSAIPSFYLAELTRRHVTVALNGDGGDESFGGYTRYVANALAGAARPRARRRCAARLRAAGAAPARGRRHRRAPATALRRLAGALALDAAERYAALHVLVRRPAARRAVHARVRGALVGAPSPPTSIAARRGRRRRATLGHRPMLEVDVADLPGGRPASRSRHRHHGLRAGGALAVARPRADGARGLDPGRAEGPRAARRSGSCARPCAAGSRTTSSTAPKQGFSVPLGDWLRGDLRAWARDVLLDPGTLGAGYFEPEAVDGPARPPRGGRRRDGQRIWALLMLELWHREFVDAPRARPCAGVAACRRRDRPRPRHLAGAQRGGAHRARRPGHGGAGAAAGALDRRRRRAPTTARCESCGGSSRGPVHDRLEPRAVRPTSTLRDRLARAAAPRASTPAWPRPELAEFTHVMKLDGDIELPPATCASSSRASPADPSLGLAGGVLDEPTATAACAHPDRPRPRPRGGQVLLGDAWRPSAASRSASAGTRSTRPTRACAASTLGICRTRGHASPADRQRRRNPARPCPSWRMRLPRPLPRLLGPGALRPRRSPPAARHLGRGLHRRLCSGGAPAPSRGSTTRAAALRPAASSVSGSGARPVPRSLRCWSAGDRVARSAGDVRQSDRRAVAGDGRLGRLERRARSRARARRSSAARSPVRMAWAKSASSSASGSAASIRGIDDVAAAVGELVLAEVGGRRLRSPARGRRCGPPRRRRCPRTGPCAWLPTTTIWRILRGASQEIWTLAVAPPANRSVRNAVSGTPCWKMLRPAAATCDQGARASRAGSTGRAARGRR